MANQATATTSEQKVPRIIIDGVTYPMDSLTDNAKKIVNTMRMTDGEIKHLEEQLVIARIAAQALLAGLKADIAANAQKAA